MLTILLHSLRFRLSIYLGLAVIFSFDKRSTDYGGEADGENCVAIVQHFLKHVMAIPNAEEMYIPVAHRIGARRPNASRQIIAKFPICDELNMVLNHTNRLKNTRHYLNRQVPAEIRERNQYALPEFKAKRQNPANKARLINGRLFVKGRLQSRFLTPTLPEVDDDVPEFTVTESESISDTGSTFKGYAAAITSLDDISAALEQSIQLDGVASATHRIYAYRYKATGGSIHENFDSDNDDGVGLELMKAMSDANVVNKLWVVTRYCKPDYGHIGKKRFDHAIAVCRDANSQLT